MKVVAAYLLAQLGGNSSPGAADIKKILSSVGADAESEKIDRLLSELEGKDIMEVLAAGREKLSAVPAGGAVAVSGGGGGGGGAAGGDAGAAEETKEEEPEEESDDDMGFSLFD